MIDMDDFMAHMRHRDGEKPRPAILPEAAVARLQEFALRYGEGCPFRPGDLVTPRMYGGIKGAGKPFIVLEVLPIASLGSPLWVGDPGSNTFGRRCDIRVAMIRDPGGIAMHWTESVEFERWPATASPSDH